jgi:hypothetical protein
VHNPYILIIMIYTYICGVFTLQEFYNTHMHVYSYLRVLLVQDRIAALLRFAGSVGNLSLLTTGDYYYHKTKNEMVERNWRPGRDMVWVLVGVTGCVPRPKGITRLHCFPCLC